MVVSVCDNEVDFRRLALLLRRDTGLAYDTAYDYLNSKDKIRILTFDTPVLGLFVLNYPK